MIIDIHSHFGRSWIGYYENKVSIEDMLRIYDDCGIEKVCLNSWSLGYDPPAGNNEIHEIVKKYPDRFIGFCVISPTWNVNAADEVDRGINELNMKGIKMHPTLNNYEADSPIVFPVMERIQKYGVPLLIHTWNDNLSHPSRIGKLAKLFPNIPFIMGHMGYEAYTEAAFIAKELPNVYLDTTGFFNAERTLPTVVRIAGMEKILFGTDSPALNAHVEVARIKFADISEDAKKAIFYKNAKKLLNL